MTRPYLPFIAFLVVLLLILPFPFDGATSVVPGWHTTIYPPHFIVTFALILLLVFTIIGYWLAAKRTDKTSWILFIIHFLLTLPTVIYVRFPSLFLDVHQADQEKVWRSLLLRIDLIPWAYGLFITGQVLFLLYFIKIIKTRSLKTSS